MSQTEEINNEKNGDNNLPIEIMQDKEKLKMKKPKMMWKMETNLPEKIKTKTTEN